MNFHNFEQFSSKVFFYEKHSIFDYLSNLTNNRAEKAMHKGHRWGITVNLQTTL